jgi:hypothetical protein
MFVGRKISGLFGLVSSPFQPPYDALTDQHKRFYDLQT